MFTKRTVDPESKRKLFRYLFRALVVVAGTGYGLTAYAIFDYLFSVEHRDTSGVMTTSFLIGVPFSTSATITYFSNLKKERRVFRSLLTAFTPIVLGALLSILLFREGSICILLFIGIAILPCLTGWMVGLFMAMAKRRSHSGTLIIALLSLPFLLGAFEHRMVPHDDIRHVARSVFIHASPEEIWHHINYPTNIQPSELQNGLAYRIGVPYPIEARTIEGRIGGTRHLKWQRGVAFDEVITAWEENRFVRWTYRFTEDSFPQGSLDDHVKLGGTYFDLQDTSYRLRPVANGTYLDVDVTFRVTTHFNWYATPWANFLIGDTAESILAFYKKRAESGHGDT